MVKKKNTYKILDGNSEGKRLLGRPRRRLESNLKTNLKELRSRECGLISSLSTQGPVVGSFEHGYEPSGFIKTKDIFD
jgi:hypothetical protein